MWIIFTTYGSNRPAHVLKSEVEAFAESEWGCTLYLKSGATVAVIECSAEVCEALGLPAPKAK